MNVERSEFRIPRSEASIVASAIAAMHCHQPIPHPERDGLWFVLAVSEEGDSWKVEVSSMPSARPEDERAALVEAFERACVAYSNALAAEQDTEAAERANPSTDVHTPLHKAIDATREARLAANRAREALQAWDREHPAEESVPQWIGGDPLPIPDPPRFERHRGEGNPHPARYVLRNATAGAVGIGDVACEVPGCKGAIGAPCSPVLPDEPAYPGAPSDAELGRIADAAFGPAAEPDRPWNWCPTCKQTIDIEDDDSEGGEVRCIGCRAWYVVCCEGDGKGKWWLEAREDHDAEDEPTRATITVERTGESRCFKGPISCEFRITYPNGHQELIWSPPWNGYGADTETAGALKAAGERWFALCDAWQIEVDQWEEARWHEANASK